MTRSSSERRWSTSSNRGAEAFKFPDFEQSLPSRETLPVHKEQASSTNATYTKTPSPNHLSKSNGIVQGGRQRRESHVAWGNTNGHLVGPGSRHVPQKSLSDAIRTIRTRKGSVSANAQELAEALKAPVSFQLVVCHVPRIRLSSALLMATPDPLHHLVHEFRPHQHLLQIHPDRPSKSNHLDIYSICLCLILVFILLISRTPFSDYTNCDTSAKTWHPLPQPGRDRHDPSPCTFSTRWSYSLIHSH